MLVAAKDYEKAQKKYDSVLSKFVHMRQEFTTPTLISMLLFFFEQGFVHIFFGKEELEVMSEEDKTKLNKVKVCQP